MKVAVISVGGKKTSQAMLILQGTLPRFVIESTAKLQREVPAPMGRECESGLSYYSTGIS